MAHLNDMEELLEGITDPDIKSYMKEALTCYMGGAYRGCIVLSCIALFDYLFFQLEELATVNKTAASIFKDVSQKREDQEVFESDLVNQLKKNKLIPELDAVFLNRVKDMRHKSAPEEARYIYADTIRKVLSQPILKTKYIIDHILEKLANSNFFPFKEDNKAIKEIVKKETQYLHTEALSYLIHNVFEKTKKVSEEGANAIYFLQGLALIGQKEALELIKKEIIEKNSDDTCCADFIVFLIKSNATLVSDLDAATAMRVQKLLELASGEINRLEALLNIAATIPKESFIEYYQDAFAKAVDDKPNASVVLELGNVVTS